RNQFVDEFRIVFLFQAVDFFVVIIDLAGIIHGAEFGAAHRAERGFFVVVVGQGFVVHGAGRLGIEREGELLLPIEFVAGVAERVVAVLRPGAMARDIGGVGRGFVGDDSA